MPQASTVTGSTLLARHQCPWEKGSHPGVAPITVGFPVGSYKLPGETAKRKLPAEGGKMQEGRDRAQGSNAVLWCPIQGAFLWLLSGLCERPILQAASIYNLWTEKTERRMEIINSY